MSTSEEKAEELKRLSEQSDNMDVLISEYEKELKEILAEKTVAEK